MTSFDIQQLPFTPASLASWSLLNPRHRNWPVVYTLSSSNKVYVGESINAAGRFKQHLEGPKKSLQQARIVLAPTFNKSVCLDLESYLIRLFAGDGQYQVLNRNDGITDAEYYNRADYQQTFADVFQELRNLGAFTRSIREIENTDLFKLSPFKALTPDQGGAVEDIVSGLFQDLAAETESRIVVQGDPGTGKTVVASYLMKLLSDIKNADLSEPVDSDSILSEFFVEGFPQLLADFRMALVVPQQSLRKSIQRVFKKTPGLSPSMVLDPFQVGKSIAPFDLLIVDEAHRLNQRASQASGSLNADFAAINTRLFEVDDSHWTQIDWITHQSRHQVFLVDEAQGVRPADVPRATLKALTTTAERQGRHYRLSTQMRVAAGSDYVGYIRAVLSDAPPPVQTFPGYDLRFFDDVSAMVSEVALRNSEHGLARTVAGYAWPWVSRNDASTFDISIGDVQLRWNSVAVDWVSSPDSPSEVGSIHTIQGYDLNYAGVIIGNDLQYDAGTGKLVFNKASYFDARGKQNNKALGITYGDQELLQLVLNIYSVLLTRGILGTYVYVCDPALRERLRPFFTGSPIPGSP